LFEQVAKDFISKLLIKEPTKRLGSGETGLHDIMSHPFLQGIDWCVGKRFVVNRGISS
jgi:hypothetical protein